MDGRGGGHRPSSSLSGPFAGGRVSPSPSGQLQGAGASGANHTQQPRIQGQTLITVVNDPRAEAAKGWWGFGLSKDLGTWNHPPPPLDPVKYPHYTRRDLGAYLKVVQALHQQFLHERSSLAETANRQLLLGDAGPQADGDQEQHAAALREVAAQGDGLAKALQKVPVQFFQEDYSVERSGLLSVEDDSLDELMARIDQLSGYLDVVETQMAREVATRSQAVSQASQQVGTLHQQLCGALANVRLLRANLGEADAHTYASTRHVMGLQQRQKNVDATLEALQVLEELHSSRAALRLLLDGQDYAGALDLLEVVAHNVEASCSQGITTFAASLPEMLETRELLESLLACEFVSLANFGTAHMALDAAVAHVSSLGPGVMPSKLDLARVLGSRHGALLAPFGAGQEDEYLEDGLYSGRLQKEEEAVVAREQMHDKLLPVVLALLRVDRLGGAIQQLHDNVVAATKGLVAEALARCLGPTGPPYLQQAGGAAAMGMLQDGGGGSGIDGPSASGEGGGQPGAAEKEAGEVDQGMAVALQALAHDSFMQVLFVVHAVVAAFLQHCTQLSSIICSDILPAARVPAPTVATVTRDTAGVTQALADVAQSRWVRLLSARGSKTLRLRLYEFQALADACEAFSQLLEPLSARAALGVRSAVQAQGKLFLEAMHARNVAQLQHLLEAEQWTLAEVAPQFQAIVDRLVQRGQLPSPGQPPGGASASRSPSPAQALLTQGGLSHAHPAGATGRWPCRQDHHQRAHSSAADPQPAAVLPPAGASLPPLPGGSQAVALGSSTVTVAAAAADGAQADSLAKGAAGGRSSSWGGPGTVESSSSGAARVPGMLHLQGKSFPLVNTTLMMIKLLDEYLTLADSSPLFVLEVGHHVCDLIRVFNTQACQLVLGAGAVRTAGLKSISAKHLALSCESCYLLVRLLPSLRGALLSGSTSKSGASAGGSVMQALSSASLEPRRRMLLLEFDKVGLDLSSHTSEIHSKLVDIMQDRLVQAARQLTQEAVRWGSPQGPPALQPDGSFQPSQALLSLHKQLTTLHTVLGPLLQQEEVQYIFGRVASLYSEALAATLDALQHPKLMLPQQVSAQAAGQGAGGGAQGRTGRGVASAMTSSVGVVSASVTVDVQELATWEDMRRRNAIYALQCLQQLPLDPLQVSTYLSRLSTFITKHYGSAALQQASRPTQLQQLDAPSVPAPLPLPPTQSSSTASSTTVPVQALEPATAPSAQQPAAALQDLTLQAPPLAASSHAIADARAPEPHQPHAAPPAPQGMGADLAMVMSSNGPPSVHTSSAGSDVPPSPFLSRDYSYSSNVGAAAQQQSGQLGGGGFKAMGSQRPSETGTAPLGSLTVVAAQPPAADGPLPPDGDAPPRSGSSGSDAAGQQLHGDGQPLLLRLPEAADAPAAASTPGDESGGASGAPQRPAPGGAQDAPEHPGAPLARSVPAASGIIQHEEAAAEGVNQPAVDDPGSLQQEQQEAGSSADAVQQQQSEMGGDVAGMPVLPHEPPPAQYASGDGAGRAQEEGVHVNGVLSQPQGVPQQGPGEPKGSLPGLPQQEGKGSRVASPAKAAALHTSSSITHIGHAAADAGGGGAVHGEYKRIKAEDEGFHPLA